MLHGREIERARLAALLDDAGDGRAGVLVVHGEAGVGKSVLLDDLVAAAGQARVLRTQGLESESPLAFAALHRLLRPVVSLLDGLPVPQRARCGSRSVRRTGRPSSRSWSQWQPCRC